MTKDHCPYPSSMIDICYTTKLGRLQKWFRLGLRFWRAQPCPFMSAYNADHVAVVARYLISQNERTTIAPEQRAKQDHMTARNGPNNETFDDCRDYARIDKCIMVTGTKILRTVLTFLATAYYTHKISQYTKTSLDQ